MFKIIGTAIGVAIAAAATTYFVINKGEVSEDIMNTDG